MGNEAIKLIPENRKEFFASDEMFEEALKKFKGQNVINYAFTDYGGSIIDKIRIRIYQQQFPDKIVWEYTMYRGMNAICIPDEDAESEYYFDGYFEELFEEEVSRYTEMTLEDYDLDPDIFNEDISGWFRDNSHLYTFGLDYSENDLEEFIEKIKRELLIPA